MTRNTAEQIIQTVIVAKRVSGSETLRNTKKDALRDLYCTDSSQIRILQNKTIQDIVE